MASQAIGMADTSRGEPDKYLALSWLIQFQLRKLEGAIDFPNDRCGDLHRDALLAVSPEGARLERFPLSEVART